MSTTIAAPMGTDGAMFASSNTRTAELERRLSAALETEQLVNSICTNDGVTRQQARLNIHEFEAAFETGETGHEQQ